MGKCQILVGIRELIPGVKGQSLSSRAGQGLGPFSFLVVACLSLEQPGAPVPSIARASPLPGALCSGKKVCRSFSAALIQEIVAPFFLTKSKWAWQLLGRGPRALFPSAKMEATQNSVA